MIFPKAPLLDFFPQKIIVRMPNWLGDCIMATPILADIKKHWPKATVTALCQGAIGDILAHDPSVDRVIKFSKAKSFFSFQQDLIKNLRKERSKIFDQNIHMERIPGEDITEELWESFFKFYQITYLKRGMQAYLNLDFFLT